MVQARLLRKSNPDSHYAKAVHKALKRRAIKNRENLTFISTDAKCKVSIGEPDYPVAAVSKRRRVIVAVNQVMKVAMITTLPRYIIPDAYLLHVPEDDSDELKSIQTNNSTQANSDSSRRCSQ